jgi:hypothetical protein
MQAIYSWVMPTDEGHERELSERDHHPTLMELSSLPVATRSDPSSRKATIDAMGLVCPARWKSSEASSPSQICRYTKQGWRECT